MVGWCAQQQAWPEIWLAFGCTSAGLARLLLSAPAPAGVVGLIRSMTASRQLACLVTVLPAPNRDRDLYVPPGRENAMSMRAELVDVVIGVDTHADTHTAAVLTAATGAVLATVTVAADADGYAELFELAEQLSGPALSAAAAAPQRSWTAGRPRWRRRLLGRSTPRPCPVDVSGCGPRR
jgi:hypothetical protein